MRVSAFLYDKSFYIMRGILSNSTCALRRVVREKMTCRAGQLLMHCCIYILFTMSSGLVRMLLFWSIIQSNGGSSRFLNTFLFIFLGLISYNCLYLDMAF